MTVPTLLLHGTDDQIVPIDIASRKSVNILPASTLVEIDGAPHGMCVTQRTGSTRNCCSSPQSRQ